MELSIYAIKYGDNGQTDWVAARSVIEALQVLVSNTTITLHELDHTDTVEVVPFSEWGNYKIKDENGAVVMTFRDWMNTNIRPDIIATSAK